MQAAGYISKDKMESEKHPERLPAVQCVWVGTKEVAHSGTVLICRLISDPHPVMELCSVEFRKAGLPSVWNDGLVFAPVAAQKTHDSQLMTAEKALPRHCENRGLALFH